jgi:hypothetical protein
MKYLWSDYLRRLYGEPKSRLLDWRVPDNYDDEKVLVSWSNIIGRIGEWYRVDIEGPFSTEKYVWDMRICIGLDILTTPTRFIIVYSSGGGNLYYLDVFSSDHTRNMLGSIYVDYREIKMLFAAFKDSSKLLLLVSFSWCQDLVDRLLRQQG